MSGWAEHRAFEAPQEVESREPEFTLDVARRMVALVQRVVRDLLHTQARLTVLRAEQRCLERQRRNLPWPDRRRRYQLDEEVAEQAENRRDLLAELEVLGVVLCDRRAGRIGFPTKINNRRAYFIWQPGDATIRHWRFARDKTLRTIPSTWLTTEVLSASGKV